MERKSIRLRKSAGKALTEMGAQLLTKLAERAEQEENVINEYLTQKNVPNWFRGQSLFQLKAADQLLNGIRDDSEQGTSHRVLRILSAIGIDPLPTKKHTRLLMKLSKGSDLAFLYFLYELYYKQNVKVKCERDRRYNINEQLILSSICHLDMVTTLRELDRILPKGKASVEHVLQERKKFLQKKWLEKNKSILRRIEGVKHSLLKKYTNCKSPYLMPLPRPKCEVKPLCLPYPGLRIKMGVYKNYKNPQYVVQNEQFRWFTQHQFQPGKRIVNRIINDELGDIFDIMYNPQTKLPKPKHRLCATHEMRQKWDNVEAMEKRIREREECLASLELGQKSKLIRERRLLNRLNKDIDMYLCHHKKLGKKLKDANYVMVMNKKDFECKNLENLIEDCRQCVVPPKNPHAKPYPPPPECLRPAEKVERRQTEKRVTLADKAIKGKGKDSSKGGKKRKAGGAENDDFVNCLMGRLQEVAVGDNDMSRIIGRLKGGAEGDTMITIKGGPAKPFIESSSSNSKFSSSTSGNYEKSSTKSINRFKKAKKKKSKTCLKKASSKRLLAGGKTNKNRISKSRVSNRSYSKSSIKTDEEMDYFYNIEEEEAGEAKLPCYPNIEIHSDIDDSADIPLDSCMRGNIFEANYIKDPPPKPTKRRPIWKSSFKCPVYNTNAYDYGHHELVETPNSSKMFFHAPTKNLPYFFNYRKIFNMDEKKENPVDIKRAFVDELNGKKATESELLIKPKLDEAVDKVAKEIWKKRAHYKKVELTEIENSRENRTDTVLPYNYSEFAIYDPNDEELMIRMLKDAMDYLRKNPKYVLASLPESHKLPSLREWIMRRYGKIYFWKDRVEEYKASAKIFKALIGASLDVRIPTVGRDIGTKAFVDYSCRNYIIEKGERVKENFYKRFDDAVMEQSRILWFAMRGYICSGGPPREAFYAYMPARRRDIIRFRLWTPYEYMDAKTAWEKRQARATNVKNVCDL